MIIGEGPTQREAVLGRAFSSATGELITKVLVLAGIEPSKTYFTYAALCRSPEDKTSRQSISSCRDRLIEEILYIKPKKILTLGSLSISSLLGFQKPVAITRFRGIGMMVEISPDVKIYTVPTINPSSIFKDEDLFRDFAADVMKISTSSEPKPRPEIDIVVPETVESALEYLDIFLKAPTISVDVETTGLSPIKDALLSIGFGALYDDGSSIAVIIPKELLSVCKAPIIRLLETREGVTVFHNAKFDLQFLAQWADRPLWIRRLWDTMMMRYVQDERSGDEGGRSYRTLGLKDLSRIRYDIPDYHFDFEEFYSQSESDRNYRQLYEYQAQDVVYTVQLYFDLHHELQLESSEFIPLLEKLLLPATSVFAEIERRGVVIDRSNLDNLKQRLSSRVDELLRRLRDRVASVYNLGDEFNPNSTPQVRRVLFDVLHLRPKVEGSTEREELMGMSRQVDGYDRQFVLDLAEFRQKSRELSKDVLGLEASIDPDGRVRSDFLLHGTSTGRLSSRGPNLQNIPVLSGKHIRDLFTVPDGWTLIEADESQLELRIAAHLSGDALMKKTFEDRLDIHRMVAASMFRKAPELVTKYERYLAKYVDFGVLYGRGAQSLVSGWEMEYVTELGGTPWTLDEAETFLSQFLDGYPGLKKYILAQGQYVEKHGYTRTETGRRRRFPYRTSRTISGIRRRAVNTPIQSLASDVIVNAIIHLCAEFPPDLAHVIFTVHDSIGIEVRSDYLDEVIPKIYYHMEKNLPVPISVPLVAEVKIGTHWGSLEEVDRSRYE